MKTEPKTRGPDIKGVEALHNDPVFIQHFASAAILAKQIMERMEREKQIAQAKAA